MQQRQAQQQPRGRMIVPGRLEPGLWEASTQLGLCEQHGIHSWCESCRYPLPNDPDAGGHSTCLVCHAKGRGCAVPPAPAPEDLQT